MRIFILHNHYQHKGGEDIVFAQEVEALRRNHDVHAMSFHNKTGWRGLLQFAGYPWNICVTKKIMRAVQKFQPDLVHIHNIHYAVGPWVLRSLHKQNIPVVVTLHNFRLLDPSASLFYHGAPYLPDLARDFPLPSVYKKVLDNSLVKTFWTAFTYYLHKKLGTWHTVDQYLSFSNFAKKLFVHSTLRIDAEHIRVKPNFAQPLSLPTPAPERENYFVYIGRLSEEKGILPLLEAFASSNFVLKIFGDGPLREEVERYAHQYANIQHEGFQGKAVLAEHLLLCQALIVPSICYEGMPLTILEAYSVGTPVLASRLGILAEMVEEGIHGLHFNPNDSSSLGNALQRWADLSAGQKKNISQNCHKTYLDKYSPQKNVLLLENIYRDIVEERKENE